MGNHASQSERRDRSKGGEFTPYSSGRASEGFTIGSYRSGQKTLQPQNSEEDQAPVILKTAKDKENEDPVPQRPRPILTHGNKKMMPVVIKWTGGGNNVAIAGTFNQWQTIPMVKSEKDFVAIVDLPEGSHEYKFLVDGEWKVLSKEKPIKSSSDTQTNSITIKGTDFEEFENALLRDPNDNNKDGHKNKGSGSDKDRKDDEDDCFSQEIPEYQPSDKMRGPPLLPPHLQQVILNKDTPISCEPTLLPEPNHVMLNHMYALSIRDGMMVLSTSHRFRKKCVTTLIYRPIE